MVVERVHRPLVGELVSVKVDALQDLGHDLR